MSHDGGPSEPIHPGARARARRRIVALVVALAVVPALVGCELTLGPKPGDFVAGGSINQVYTSGHVPGDAIELADGRGVTVASGVADAQGAYLFRGVPVGNWYSVRSPRGIVRGINVYDETYTPPPTAYGAQLGEGFGYIPTRDGTLLSANVQFPVNGAPPPWPVVIDYSGYDPSDPGGSLSINTLLAFMGYAVVGVNMRGTACSGGAFDYFEPLQGLDGYDVVETLARQSWSNGHVGMAGISYPGISQLFVGRTRPPHLDAITPLSVIGDTYAGILYPGGIRNVGFPLDWARERDADAAPAAHQWVRDRIANGDTTCAANQVMRLQSRNLAAEITDDRAYETIGDALAPRTFVDRITAPTFISGAYQDEQTGGYWATMLSNFAPGTKVKMQLTNGTHVESLGPEHANRVIEFLEFYVAHRIPSVPDSLRGLLPAVYEQIFGITGATVEPDRFTGYGSYEAALAAYEAEPPVRVYWENGGGGAAGAPYSTVRSDYASWPPPGTAAESWYLQPDGVLGPAPPTVADDEPRGSSSYKYDPATKSPPRTFGGSSSDMWRSLPAVTWKPLAEGYSLSYVTPAFTAPAAYAGSGSADLWLRSTDVDTDVEVTITEVRADGKETYVQSGWLRASHRRVDPARSTELVPHHTFLAEDREPLVPGQWSLARVELFPFAHVFRAGSRLRVDVEVPGGNQPLWQIDPRKVVVPVTNEIAHTAGRASRVVLPRLAAAAVPAVPAAARPCPGLRGQACRTYTPARIPTGVAAATVGGQLVVTWNAPPGATPASYQVRDVDRGTVSTVAGSIRTLTVAGAVPGETYRFRVNAVYGGVASPASDASPSYVF